MTLIEAFGTLMRPEDIQSLIKECSSNKVDPARLDAIVDSAFTVSKDIEIIGNLLEKEGLATRSPSVFLDGCNRLHLVNGHVMGLLNCLKDYIYAEELRALNKASVAVNPTTGKPVKLSATDKDKMARGKISAISGLLVAAEQRQRNIENKQYSLRIVLSGK